MPMFRLENDQLKQERPATFRDLKLYERGDLQRLLRAQPEALGEDLLIISEEFGNWQESNRRIDLLALDDSARLVVIELKRTDDGGHMELQALRYAAMVSSMSFDELVAAHAAHHLKVGSGDGEIGSSRDAIAEFLGTDADEVALSSDVRIMLVSADFGREITTAVLWLNRFEGMDIRCIRLKPYSIDDRVLIDIEQIIPLPEAESYQVQIGRKDAARARKTTVDTRDFTKYVISDNGRKSEVLNKRNAVRVMVEAVMARGVTADAVRAVIRDRKLRSLDGRVEAGEAVSRALSDKWPEIDLSRFYTEHPIHQGNRTHVLFKMWGQNTEPTLNQLSRLVDGAVTYESIPSD